MAVTHNDLSVSNRSGADISSQRGLFLVVFSVLCGLASFVLSLAAEARRSEATWLMLSSERDGRTYECFYSGSGRTPLTCAVAAFLALATAMFTEHAYILITVSSPRPPALVAWTAETHDPDYSSRALTRQACFFFITTWICFAVAEVLLMVGIAVESGHLTNWTRPRSNCLVVRQGLYAAAGVFGLTTVFLAAGLYLTALRAQRRLQRDEETMPQEVPEPSAPYLSAQPHIPARLPRNPYAGHANENQPSIDDPSQNKTSTSAQL